MLVQRLKKCSSIAILAMASILISSHCAASWWDKIVDVVKEEVKDNSSSTGANPTSLSTTDLSGAFKQALELGSQRVVKQLGVSNGFNGDSAIRIALPKNMQKVKGWLDKVGMGDSLASLEVKLNRAAENAVPKAKDIFVSTIKQMSFDDVKSIYSGGDDAATRYFQSKMTPALKKEMQPVVENSLSQVGAINTYDKVMSDYKSIPFVSDVKANLVSHVVDGGLDGIFHYLAKEEAAIRKDPIKQTTRLLKKVFGQ